MNMPLPMDHTRHPFRTNVLRTLAVAAGFYLAASLCLLPSVAHACPFCSATSQTLSEELAGADVSVIAALVEPLPPIDPDDPAGLDSDETTGGAKFQVVTVLRGSEHSQPEAEIEVVYFGEDEAGKQFLINGIAGDTVDWITPLPLSERAVEYVQKLDTLPEKGVDRLRFFMQHFEDEDPLLAQDAYDEFARAPYSDVIALKEYMDREQLVEWIINAQVGPTRRRLYLTLLGVCGTPEDADMLEALLQYEYDEMKPGFGLLTSVMQVGGTSLGAPIINELAQADVRSKQQCLDAMIAAFLKLRGPEGLPLIEQRFLANPHAEYTHLYSTIMALRFHGEESDEIPQDRLIQSLRLLLDNEEIADQVIPDLARWEDWESLDRLVKMFKNSSEDSWIRQPVLSYLLTATEVPGDVGTRANEAVSELEELDPTGVKRARSYLAFGLMARAGGGATAKGDTAKQGDAASTGDGASAANAAAEEPSGEAVADSATNSADDPQAATASTEGAEQPAQQARQDLPPTADVAEADAPPPPSRTMIIGVPIVAGLLLMGLFGLLLRGADVRSHTTTPPPRSK